MRTNARYSDKLNHVLHYYIGVLWAKKKDYEACMVLVDKIIPLIRSIDPKITKQWEEEARSYADKKNQRESNLLAVCKETFSQLKSRLEVAGLASEQSIKQRLCIIDSILEFRPEDDRAVNIGSGKEPKFICTECGLEKFLHRVYVLPSYAWGLEQEIKGLCNDVAALERYDLLEGFVELRYIDEYFRGELGDYCTKTAIKVPYISAFTFVSSIDQQSELDPVLSFEKNGTPLWIAWNMLRNIEWCLKGSRDYLRKKYLRYDDVDNCIRSTRLLQEHAAWVDIKAIKNGKKTTAQEKIIAQETAIYSRKRIKSWVASIMAALPVTNTKDLATTLPYALELDMPKEGDLRSDLRLKIELQPGIIEVVSIHTFQETVNTSEDPVTNCAEKFIRDLYDSPGTFVKIGNVSGANAKKYLARVGIKGILKELLVESCTGKEAKLKSRIELNNKPEYILKKVRSAIQKFATIGWFLTIFFCFHDLLSST
jgi:hypothetical protein